MGVIDLVEQAAEDDHVVARFAGLWGMPDQRGFGVFWVDHEALAAAYDMEGAFNRVAVKLAPQASEPAVLDGLSRLLAPVARRRWPA